MSLNRVQTRASAKRSACSDCSNITSAPLLLPPLSTITSPTVMACTAPATPLTTTISFSRDPSTLRPIPSTLPATSSRPSPPPAPAFTPEQFAQVLTTLSSNLNANQQATVSQLTALTQSLQQGQSQSSSGYSAKPPTFHGDGIESVDQFLSSFERHADFFGWTPVKRLRALPLSLVGHANIWFTSLDSDSYRTYDELTGLLREQFNSPASQWLARQQLNQRKMAPSESVADYSADIRRRCQLLRIPKAEWLHVFISGIRSDIKQHLVLQQPQTFEQAEQQAKLKEAVSTPDPVATQTHQIAQALLSQLQKSSPTTSQPQQVAAFSTAPHLADRGAEEPLTPSSIRAIVQKEIRQALREQAQNSGRQPAPRYNARGNNQFRNRRTAQGHPICNTCNRAGHISYNCPTLSHSQRDPRLPQANRNFPNRRPQPAPYNQGNL